MIKKFDDFINEGIREQMIPKSTEDIKNELKGKPFNYIAHNLELQGLNINDYLTKEDIKNILSGESYFYTDYNLKLQGLKIEDIFTKEEIDKMDKMSFSYVDDDQEMIFIDTERMKKVLSVVGEGIKDVIVAAKMINFDEFQNEALIKFWENAWGGISLEEWNKLDTILKKIVDKNGLYYYDLDTVSATLLLTFDSKYEIEEI